MQNAMKLKLSYIYIYVQSKSCYLQVEVRVNMGKDFSKDTVEVTGLTDPGAYMAFSGIDYDLYAYGGMKYVFVTENDASSSFIHRWGCTQICQFLFSAVMI